MARKTSGNSCGRTGSPIGCSNHSMISSITAAMPGTLSSISPGRSCPSRVAIGQTWVIQCEDWYYTETLMDVLTNRYLGSYWKFTDGNGIEKDHYTQCEFNNNKCS